MEPVELLKQNLTIEPDLQNFIGFVLDCVNKLDGNAFAASVVLLDLMQKLRNANTASAHTLPVSLLLQERQLQVHWEGRYEKIALLAQLPGKETVEQLRLHMQNSTALTDPDILLQRNAEMARYLDEVRLRTEKEIEALQLAVEKRQNELHESMRQAETDPLTGLLNRRAYDEKLSRAFHHTMRQKSAPLSLVLLDLDHFKKINDEFGHQYGDTYLNKLAHALRSVIREEVDFAFRIGGDEFAMVIFADYPLACDKAQQVLELMKNKISIGITAINPDTLHTMQKLTMEEYIHRADSALYEAKHRGRGRIVVDICLSSDGGDCVFPCPKMKDAERSRYAEYTGEYIPPCLQLAANSLQTVVEKIFPAGKKMVTH